MEFPFFGVTWSNFHRSRFVEKGMRRPGVGRNQLGGSRRGQVRNARGSVLSPGGAPCSCWWRSGESMRGRLAWLGLGLRRLKGESESRAPGLALEELLPSKNPFLMG